MSLTEEIQKYCPSLTRRDPNLSRQLALRIESATPERPVNFSFYAFTQLTQIPSIKEKIRDKSIVRSGTHLECPYTRIGERSNFFRKDMNGNEIPTFGIV